ncbi:MAG TPA: helix-turn-helix transcriptional regulator, partial [Nocardioidaceae bacterium]|nr:helix-turn-helix transcriptional regulator [Nocardioidaceae bacterium]
MTNSSSGTLLRDARTRAGLTQSELAQRAGTTQSVISAYESDRRQPALTTLEGLVAATGLELEV